MNLTERKELKILLDALRENVITEEQFKRLDQMIVDDRQAGVEYLRYVKLWTDLQFFQAASHQNYDRVMRSGSSKGRSGVTDLATWQALADEEINAPTIQLPAVDVELAKELVSKVEYQKVARRVNKTTVVSFILSAAAMLFVVLFIQFAPNKSNKEVAIIADSLEAVWGNSRISTEQGAHLSVGDSELFLREGIAKLVFVNDAVVTVEGPAEFDIVAGDRINLHYGRLYSIIPQQAIGFSVTTPNAMVIDLGTEFGVDVDFHGNTELYVTQGKTTLVSMGQQGKVSMEVGENTAKKISRISAAVADIPCDETLFVRDINSGTQMVWRGQNAINLTDVFCGGNGLGSGSSEESINPVSGEIVECISEDRAGDGQYVRVPDRRFIDGVFVPNAANGPVVVSSQNHIFKECPVTNNIYFFDIHKGLDHDFLNFDDDVTRDNLMLHANQGITFDLKAIRAEYPFVDISRFTSQVGIATSATREGNADVWVLVDGQVRYSYKQMSEKGKPYSIMVDLNKSDRFLTLVVTDGEDVDLLIESGRATDSDWVIFVEPQLELSF